MNFVVVGGKECKIKKKKLIMDVSIIIVNYQSSNLVIDCINSIFQKTKEISYEIIIVDNASNDNSVECLTKIFGDKVKIISSKLNLGFGKANNLGEKYAVGKYIFLLNPDTILVNNAIKILMNSLKKNEDIGCVGGNLYTLDMRPCPSYSLLFDDLNTERKYASWYYLIKNKIEQKFSFKNKKIIKNFNYDESIKEVAYIFGADMMMEKSLFDKLGGFDPDFFMYAEEEELSWRIKKDNKKNCSVPQAKIIHLEGATQKTDDSFNKKSFKLRLNGTMTYFKKRFGMNGVYEFYKLRSLRYKRLIKIAKVQGKNMNNFIPIIQLECLEECYKKFINNKDKEIKDGRN